MKRLAILTNIIAPYRIPIYASLAGTFDQIILHGGTEPNRTWTCQVPESVKDRKVLTLQIPVQKKTGIPGIFDTNYLHFNLGLLWSLPRFRPNIIVTHEMGLRTVIGLLYGKLAQIPVWVWWEGTLHSERNITRARSIIRSLIVRHAKRWISSGRTSTDYLLSLGVPREHILQIQLCGPQEVFLAVPSSANAWFKDQPRPVILSVGQLIPRKGLNKLIEACGRQEACGREFTLVLVGQGPERANLEQLARQFSLKHFLILPNQSQPALNEIYRSADVFVLPTLEDVWGLVVNEAMWAGTPVLCSKYAGCAPELLPETNIFDPMSNESMDAALASVFERSVSPPDVSRLKTWQQVSSTICHALQNDSTGC
jgi:glycosyltransferase involved in cell wall biosynthesis